VQVTGKPSPEAVGIASYPGSDTQSTEHVLDTYWLHPKDNTAMAVVRQVLLQQFGSMRGESGFGLPIAFHPHLWGVGLPVYVIGLDGT